MVFLSPGPRAGAFYLSGVARSRVSMVLPIGGADCRGISILNSYAGLASRTPAALGTNGIIIGARSRRLRLLLSVP